MFWTYVVEALRRALPAKARWDGPVFNLTSDPVPWVVDVLSRFENGVILVLDDYHELRSDEVDEAVGRLIRYLPDTSTIIISTRRDPNVSVTRWQASERFAEIRQADLRFDDHETQRWLEGHGIEATAETVAVFLDVFEGWPAAYALALGSIAAAPDQAAALAEVRGDAGNVAAYIRNEVIGRDAKDRDVLLVAALCPQVCGSLIDHALETTGSQETLRRLYGSNVLLERVDPRGKWFRLHRLVADYLQAEYDDQPIMHMLTVRSAAWHIANDQPLVALTLFQRAGDYGSAADTLNRQWLLEMALGHRERLRTNLAGIEPHVAASSPSYLVTRAWLLAQEGRTRDARSLVHRAAALSDGGPLPDGAPSVEATQAVMDCLYLLNGFPTTLRSAAQADALVPPSSEWRPFADLALGFAYYMAGELDKAHAAFGCALASPLKVVRAIAIGWSAAGDAVLGDLDAARARLAEAAAEWSDDPALEEMPAVVVAKAAVECGEGRPFNAVAQLEACLQSLQSDDPPVRLEVLIWLADVEARIGRSDRARRRLTEAEALASRIGGSDWHRERLSAIEGRLGSGPVRAGHGPGLTQRETRILQLLSATHLSQREIGRELGVSFNTIKSHVKSVYVKLGASSREEASQIGRNRGLV
jgi:LuxR family maltose regulon positive regulatory protein